MASVSTLAGLLACTGGPAENLSQAQAASAPVEGPKPIEDLRECLRTYYFDVQKGDRSPFLSPKVPEGDLWMHDKSHVAVEAGLAWQLNGRETKKMLLGTEPLGDDFAAVLFDNMGHAIAVNASPSKLETVKQTWTAECPMYSDLLFYSSKSLIEAGLGKNGPVLCIPREDACGMVLP